MIHLAVLRRENGSVQAARLVVKLMARIRTAGPDLADAIDIATDRDNVLRSQLKPVLPGRCQRRSGPGETQER